MKREKSKSHNESKKLLMYTVKVGTEAKCYITNGVWFQKEHFYKDSNTFSLVRDALQSVLQDNFAYFPLIPLIFICTHTSNTWSCQCHTQQAHPILYFSFPLTSWLLNHALWMLRYRPAASHVVLGFTVILTLLLPREKEREREQQTDKERDENTHTRHREGRQESLAQRCEAPFSGLSLSQSNGYCSFG